MNNYLTVPAHRVDSPTMSRARIGSGRWEEPAPGALGACAVLHLLSSPWLSSPDHPRPTSIQTSPRGFLFRAEAPSSLPSTIPTGKSGWAVSPELSSLHPRGHVSVRAPPSPPQGRGSGAFSPRICCHWIPSLSITHLLCDPRFLLSCVSPPAPGTGCRVSGCGAAAEPAVRQQRAASPFPMEPGCRQLQRGCGNREKELHG